MPDERARRFNLRSALVVAQVALSLVLLVAAGLFLRSLREVQARQPGFDVERLVSAQLPDQPAALHQDQGRAFYRASIERVEALPGVEAAAVARVRGAERQRPRRPASTSRAARAPTTGSGTRAAASPRPGRDAVSVNVVGPRLLPDARHPAAGAAATSAPRTRERRPPVAIVNETLRARLHFPDGSRADALGQRISVDGPRGPVARDRGRRGATASTRR